MHAGAHTQMLSTGSGLHSGLLIFPHACMHACTQAHTPGGFQRLGRGNLHSHCVVTRTTLHADVRTRMHRDFLSRMRACMHSRPRVQAAHRAHSCSHACICANTHGHTCMRERSRSRHPVGMWFSQQNSGVVACVQLCTCAFTHWQDAHRHGLCLRYLVRLLSLIPGCFDLHACTRARTNVHACMHSPRLADRPIHACLLVHRAGNSVPLGPASTHARPLVHTCTPQPSGLRGFAQPASPPACMRISPNACMHARMVHEPQCVCNSVLVGPGLRPRLHACIHTAHRAPVFA